MTAGPIQAAQPSFGYSIQEGRMLYRLLAGDLGDEVAYEVWDDVTVVKEDGKHIVEQITSSQSANPLTNAFPKPWHALSNWIDGVNASYYDPEHSDFILYVLQDYPLGPKIKLLHDADTLEKAEQALNDVKEFFWGAAPSYPKRKTVAENKKKYLENLFTANKEIVCQIIKNFRVVTGDFNPETELKKAIANTHFSPNVHDDVLTTAIGWLKRKKDEHLSAERRFILTREETLSFLNQIQKQYDSSISIDYVIDEPSEGEAAQQVDRSPIYIRQLEIIELEESEKFVLQKIFSNRAPLEQKWQEVANILNAILRT